ncbi:MAG: Coenzyme F420 hydrogenase/dehydrogenase, beta subunit C-terminal domain [Planctomycetota bacterium]
MSTLAEVAKKLIESGKVETIIGYEKGTLPLRSRPVFIKKPEDTQKLTFNSFCENNLAVYLPKRPQKTAVVAKGCDARSILALRKEKQIPKDSLYVIGVVCDGVIDRGKIEKALGQEPILSAEEKNGIITVVTNKGSKEFSKSEVLRPNCAVCEYKTPVVCDELVGNKIQEQKVADKYKNVLEAEKKPSDEKWAKFTNESAKCIRCYACRQACPMCYCPRCFVDEGMPKWIDSGQNESDVQIFQMVRVLHLAGRCTDCGACVSACPMDVDIRNLLQRLEKTTLDRFNHRVGVNPDELPPLAAYAHEDKLNTVIE